ncbi:glycosyltransferase family 4 protein [Candidatus Falkowbacteria bacterium]|nr:glycosyltransferase family 4 protein [Candidatus Falkowbacteria bacterium]
MTIGIDASRANKSEKTGTEWYSHHLIQELKKIADPKDQFVLYSPEKLRDEIGDLPPNWQSRILNWPPKKLWTQIRLSWEMWQRPPEMLFIPAHTIPFIHPNRVVTTCHDVAFLRLPEAYDWLALKYHKFAIKFAIRHAAKIISVSEFTKNELIEFFKISPERIVVVPNGYDSERYKVIEDKEVVAKVLEKYKITEPYILYAGRMEEKKNTAALIKAFKILKKNHQENLKLVLVGQRGFGFQKVAKAIADNDLQNDVIMPGWVGKQDLPHLMNGAAAFVFPSLYEGFGIPVLEAMACGTPVVASGIPALREVAGEAAYLVDPYSPENMAEGINRVLTDDHLREDLKIRGLDRARQFSWERCARETWKVLEELR